MERELKQQVCCMLLVIQVLTQLKCLIISPKLRTNRQENLCLIVHCLLGTNDWHNLDVITVWDVYDNVYKPHSHQIPLPRSDL